MKMEVSGKIIVLLGQRGAGKTGLLLSALDQRSPPVFPDLVSLLPNPSFRIGMCSKQELAQSHLSARGNLELMAALYGLDKPDCAMDFLARSDLRDVEGLRADQLSRYWRRVLQLGLALLGDPDLLLVDDLAAGLSSPSKRALWQLLLAEQKRRPRCILYATRDLEAAAFLGDEVWFVEGDEVCQQWLKGEMPEILHSSAGFAIGLKSAAAVRWFIDQIGRLDWVISHSLRDPRTVEVRVKDIKNIVDLTFLAGFNLVGFQSLPMEVGELRDGWHQSGVRPRMSEAQWGLYKADALIQRSGPPTGLSPRHRLRAILGLARAEWRGHFRSFWKAGNLLFSGFFGLSGLVVILQLADRDAVLHWTSLVLLLLAAMGLGLGMESISRLITTGGMGALFQPPQARDMERPLSILALYDRTPVGRYNLMVGVWLGQFAILAAHSWPLLLIGWVLRVPVLLGIGLLIWGLSALTTLALTTLIGLRLTRPGRGKWLGWTTWLPMAIGSWYLSSLFPVFWLWPLSGYAAAFELWLEPSQATLPFVFALVGTTLLCLWAAWVFGSYKAIWSAKR